MILALLPLGLLAYTQNRSLNQALDKQITNSLMGETLLAANAKLQVIRRTRNVLEGLADLIPMLDDEPAFCESLVRVAAHRLGDQVRVGFVPASGLMECASTGRIVDFSGHPLFLAERGKREASMVVSSIPQGGGGSQLGLLQPVIDQTGTYLGYVSAWIPHDLLRKTRQTLIVDEADGSALPIKIWSFDGDGQVLTSSIEFEATHNLLPAGRTVQSLIEEAGTTFTAKANNGEMITYAVLALEEGKLYLVGSWQPLEARSGWASYQAQPTWFPLLMWVIVVLAAVVGAELLMGRYIRALHNAITLFATGDRRRQELDLRGAPVELREMAEAYLSMTDSITLDEASLEDSIHQKEVLLREVHHRVKNNLQLISSIINMQMRKSDNVEVKRLFRSLQDRIMSIATVHHNLYQTSGQMDVRMDELLREIAGHVLRSGALVDQPIDVRQSYDDLRLVPDQAMSLALLVSEALSHLVKQVAQHSGDSVPFIAIELKRVGGAQAGLRICNNFAQLQDAREAAATSSIYMQLIQAFAIQLGAVVDQSTDGQHYSISVTFTAHALSDAEQVSLWSA